MQRRSPVNLRPRACKGRRLPVVALLCRPARPFVLVWFLLTDVMTVFPGALLPSPVKVANAFVRAIASGELPGNIGASLQRILYADLAALALGVPLGLAMGLYQRIEKLLDGL